MIDALQATAWEAIPLERVNEHMQRRIVTGELMTVAQIFMKDGFLVPLHSHVNEQITQVISGKMRFRFGADRATVRDLGPGEIIVIPANLPHEALMIGDVVEIDMWAPRRDDWLNKTDDYLRR
jgi:quercetin dioxygenase-like cupin family protein